MSSTIGASAAAINAKVWRGFAIAASKLGLPYSHYRPTAAVTPISNASLRGTLPVSFDPGETLKYSSAPGRGDETRGTLVDGAAVRVGDYLIGPAGTFFITSREPLLPIQSVLCNATIDVLRHTGTIEVGVVDYGHETEEVETAILQGWPASMLLAGTAAGMGGGIPGAPSDPSFDVLLPRLPSDALTINTGDVVADNLARRLLVTAAELTAHGWRCRARLVAGG